MKKLVKEMSTKSMKELEKKVQENQLDIAKLQLEAKTNPQKDTNLLFKKRKQVAVFLTLINEKQAAETLAVKK